MILDRHGDDEPIAPAATTLLSAHELVLSFGRTKALDRVSVDIAPGEIVALVGPSGSGKSTLLHCLAGIMRPDSGHVLFRGERFDDLGDARLSRLRRESFGFVFQFGSLVPELSAAENVSLPLRLLGWRKGRAQQAACEWLERLNVGAVANQRPGEMSGGQAQRVAVARALISRPSVVFADEPTGALDRANGIVVVTTLTDVARDQGTAVVLVTHDEAVAATADRRLHLRDGLLLQDEPVS